MNKMRDSHHDHLINLRDGKVIEFTSEEIEKLQAKSRKLGYKLVDHRLSCIASRWTMTNPDRCSLELQSISSFSTAMACWSTAKSFRAAHAEILTRHGYPSRRTDARTFSGRLGSRSAPNNRNRDLPQASRRFRSTDETGRAAVLRGRSANHSPCRRGDRRDRSAQMRGIERHARQDSPWPHLRRLYDLLAPSIFSASQVERGKPARICFFAAGKCGPRRRDAS